MAEANVLHRSLRAAVDEWRRAGHPCEFPAVAEILRFARDERGERRHLRAAQLEALETYWYLRVALGTPRVIELARRLSLDVATDEALTLAYPSYIFALAMGAGKTLLIGAILACELALAQEYPGASFARNALVFAPGKTILESLRELVHAPYAEILPPRLWRRLAASLKITLARDGAAELPVIAGSSHNVVVTNSEKIRIQRDGARDRDVANRRLQALASLPDLAIFADEAHHTYGPSLADGLKRIRQTVDYLAAGTRVICVVNTTGTPYHRRQLLPDVVFWYGLCEAIEDGVLKSVSGGIRAYEANEGAALVAHVIEDFCRDYGDVRLENGARAKLALYFPQTKDLRALRPAIDAALGAPGWDPRSA
jgi:hypothetical protein